MDRFVVRSDAADRVRGDLVDAYQKRPRCSRTRKANPWNVWSSDQKKQYAPRTMMHRYVLSFCHRFLAELAAPGSSYKVMYLKYGRACPGRSTVRDWLVRYKTGQLPAPMGRPGLLTEEEQKLLFAAVSSVREAGGAIDAASLVYMGETLIEKNETR